MDHATATLIASILKGTVLNTGGNIHLVKFTRPDGSFVVLSEDAVAEYANQDDFDKGVEVSSVEFWG